jgi:ribosomal-protein-alanine N-acetyltransferase
MIETKVYNPAQLPSVLEKKELVDFLFKHLEQYGDPGSDIEKCIGYALKETPSFGGFVIAAHYEGQLGGVVVVNHTGMSGYIPENILVYIATHGEMRGKKIGKTLMEEAIKLAQGDIALHVEANNPAIGLYEKMGFTNPYLEMRLKK